MPEGECFPDPNGMTDEEKIELIEQLHEANHFHIEQVIGLVESLQGLALSFRTLAEYAEENDAVGKRTKALRILAIKMALISKITLESLDITEEDVQVAEQFASIVGDLDGDPQFDINGEEER